MRVAPTETLGSLRAPVKRLGLCSSCALRVDQRRRPLQPDILRLGAAVQLGGQNNEGNSAATRLARRACSGFVGPWPKAEEWKKPGLPPRSGAHWKKGDGEGLQAWHFSSYVGADSWRLDWLAEVGQTCRSGNAQGIWRSLCASFCRWPWSFFV